MYKIYKKIHLWLAVPFGLILTLICATGAILEFEPEITRQLQHDVYYVDKVSDKMIDTVMLRLRVQDYLGGDVALSDVYIPDNPERTYQFSLIGQHDKSVMIDQYTGVITGMSSRPEFFMTTMRLHRWLLNSPAQRGAMTPGKMIVAVSVIAMVLILISGVLMWIKRYRRNVRKGLTVPLRKGAHQFWSGLHVAGGMYAVIFLLIMALTGLTWSFGWWRSALAALFGIERGSNIFYQVHTGTFWEGITRLVWFCAALIGMSLPLTGYYMWLKRIVRRKS